PVRGGLIRHPLGAAPRPRSVLLPTLIGSAVGVAALALTEGTWRSAVMTTMIYGVIGLSLVIVTRYAGQVAVAQLALAGARGIRPGSGFPRFACGPVCLRTLVAVACGTAKLRPTALGSAMLAVPANERSAAGLGVNVVRVKIISFGLASFVARLGGGLLAYR